MTIPEFGPLADHGFSVLSSQRREGVQTHHKEGTERVIIPPSSNVAFSSVVGEYDAIVTQVRALPDIRDEAMASAQRSLVGHHGGVSGDLVAAGLIKETVLDTLSIR